MARAKAPAKKTAKKKAAHGRNPALWVISNPPTIQSESKAWAEVRRLAAKLARADDRAIRGDAKHVTLIADAMAAQLRRGVHKNPGTPAPRGVKFSDHVQAIVYEHTTEGPRVHGFGNADPVLRTRGNTLSMTGLHGRTQVAMFAMPDGSIAIRSTNGKPLWRRDA